MNNYTEYIRPELAGKLHRLKLDYEVMSSAGCFMHIQDASGRQRKILDLISGYGSCLLGHNHPVLKEAFIQALQSDTVSHAHLSNRAKAGNLGEHLNKIARSETGKEYIITLVNSGAEAVEAAIKHALLVYKHKINKFITSGQRTFSLYLSQAPAEKVAEIKIQKEQWQTNVNSLLQQNPPVFLALNGAFHGKTLGALSLTQNPVFRNGFEATLTKCVFLNPSEIVLDNLTEQHSFRLPYPELKDSALSISEKNWHPFAALFAEPIQGEAGVIPLTHVQANNLRALCNTLEIPLIWDEIQSGCFRTGNLFASTQLGVLGDYFLLGKSLGGGLVKTAALLVEKSQYESEFGLVHTSTFAEDEISSLVANRFLDLAHEAALVIISEGEQWAEMLRTVAAAFPEVIKEIRGKGLIYGIEFYDYADCGYYGFQSVSRGGYLNYLLAAWLFHHHRIRFSAPLSNSHTLRMHPALGCSSAEIEIVRHALSELCHVLKCQDFYALISFLLPVPWQKIRQTPVYFKAAKIDFETPTSSDLKAGFITHYIDENTLSETDPSLTCLPVNIIENLLEDFQDMLSPVITGGRKIVTKTGETVHLTMVGSPFTAAMVRKAMDKKELSSYRKTLSKAVALLEEETDPAFIGLGQYTSIIAANGLFLAPKRANLTSGNGLTAFITAETFLNQCRSARIETRNESLAIFGAGGNIGTALCSLQAPVVKELVLFGNPNSTNHKNFEKLIATLSLQTPTTRITVAENVAEARNCRLVIAATSQPQPFLTDDNLHPEAVVCDLSVPVVVDQFVIQNPGLRKIMFGGIAQLPDGKAVPTKGFPLSPGLAYACLAETLILTLAGKPELASFGGLKQENVLALGEMAKKYGFVTAEPKVKEAVIL